MRKAIRRSRAAVASEASGLLTALAAKGAYALPPGAAEPGRDTCSLFSSRAGSEPVAHATRAAMSHALQNGWLELDNTGARIVLAPAGQRVVRAARRKAALQAKAGRSRGRRAVPAQEVEGPLAWLRKRRDRLGKPFMSEAQISAAERLASDFWRGGMSPRVTANWSAAAPAARTPRATPGVGIEMSDVILLARQRFFAALDAVGPELSRMLVHVCCHEVGLEEIEEAAGWPPRTARVVLDLGLTQLARHYGLLAPERPISGRLRHWGDADYRPSLAGWR
jgi:hypothetical protein